MEMEMMERNKKKCGNESERVETTDALEEVRNSGERLTSDVPSEQQQDPTVATDASSRNSASVFNFCSTSGSSSYNGDATSDPRLAFGSSHNSDGITWHTNSGRRKTLKRKRPFFWELTVSLQAAPSRGGDHPTGCFGDGASTDFYEDNDDHDNYDHHQQKYDHPEFKTFLSLTSALLLTCTMAVVSALDAKTKCVQHETYAVEQLVDDDIAAAAAAADDDYDVDKVGGDDSDGTSNTSSNNMPESEKCIQLVQTVILPVGVATAACALAAIGIMWAYHRRSHASVVRVTSALFTLYLCILGLQTYHVTMLMLKPRADYDFYNAFYDEDDDDSSNSNTGVVNPYQSLAASDRFGQVGANANLYYLSWCNEGLAMYLVYQVATACFRVCRAARSSAANKKRRQQQQQQQQSLSPTTSAYNCSSAYVMAHNKTEFLLPSTSWDITTPNNSKASSRRQQQQHAYRTMLKTTSRAAWYTSLYRLRMRTGIWSAAFICCLLICASSQYIWSQALWPYVSQVVHYGDASYHGWSSPNTVAYFSVCRDASSQSNGYFVPQLCQRTLLAWLSGVIAAILCATAIALHVAGRFRRSGTAARDHHHQDDEAAPTAAVAAAAAAAAAANNNRATTTTTTPYYYQDVVHLLRHGVDDDASATSWMMQSSPAVLMRQYYAHHHPKRLSLRTELLLAILLSVLLGVNAVLVTGVQGPAATVGNLYYASWLSFLLCIRICLGCVEEFYNIADDEDDHEHPTIGDRSSPRTPTSNTDGDNIDGDGIDPRNRINPAYEAPEFNGTKVVSGKASCAPTSKKSTTHKANTSSSPFNSVTDAKSEKHEKTRLKRVRGYFFLSIFSTVCAASAYDAALNQKLALSRAQKYLMRAPCIVAALSYLLFGMCLSKSCYTLISRFWFGGILSLVSFSICLGNLVLTMHSEDSWAVNGIGEVEMANLYYFSWASILSSGIQMTSYVKAALGVRKVDYTAAFWVAICKVCFVILGAALHIWNTISDNCEFDEITLGAVTFCSRTVLAITISLTGMLVGGLVVVGRLLLALCPRCKCARIQAHVEMLISLFLVLLFTAAVALITGIGGPGQSVGDLYYSTWLAFWVSLTTFVECYKQLTDEEKDLDDDEQQSPTKLPVAGAGAGGAYC